MPTAGLRPQWRETRALQEGTTTANMDTDKSKEQQDAGVGTFLAALREHLAEAIAATISQRINTPPKMHHTQGLTDTMTAVGVEMYHHHTEPTLLRVGDDNLCTISLGQEDERGSEFDPSELLIRPFSQTIREAGEPGGNTGQNQIRRAAICLRKKARKTAPTSLALRAAGRPLYTLTLQLTAHHHSVIGGTRGTDITEQWRKTVSTAPKPTATSSDPNNPNHTLAPAATAMPGAQADDEEELELDYEENDSAMEVDTAQRAAAETPDSEWETDDDAAHPSGSSQFSHHGKRLCGSVRRVFIRRNLLQRRRRKDHGNLQLPAAGGQLYHMASHL
eukprot:jgi/Tetstr1/426688/TSEL_016958.t1